MAGLAESNTVDLVAQDDGGDFLVIMVETRPWGSDARQPLQLREKINAYAAFILDGGLVRHYPDAARRPVSIQLDCWSPPAPEISSILTAAAAKLKTLGIGFRVNVHPPDASPS